MDCTVRNKKKQLAALFLSALARKLISNGTTSLITLNMTLSPSLASSNTLKTPMTSVNFSLVPLVYLTVMRLAETVKSLVRMDSLLFDPQLQLYRW